MTQLDYQEISFSQRLLFILGRYPNLSLTHYNTQPHPHLIGNACSCVTHDEERVQYISRMVKCLRSNIAKQ